MKARLINLVPRELNSIRTGQMFQIESRKYGNWKGRAVRTPRDNLMFEKPLTSCKILVAIYDIDSLLYLDPLG